MTEIMEAVNGTVFPVWFLIGAALIYGVAGTLNMAELGLRWSTIAAADRGLFDAGVALLGVAFLIKVAD